MSRKRTAAVLAAFATLGVGASLTAANWTDDHQADAELRTGSFATAVQSSSAGSDRDRESVQMFSSSAYWMGETLKPPSDDPYDYSRCNSFRLGADEDDHVPWRVSAAEITDHTSTSPDSFSWYLVEESVDDHCRFDAIDFVETHSESVVAWGDSLDTVTDSAGGEVRHQSAFWDRHPYAFIIVADETIPPGETFDFDLEITTASASNQD